MRTFWTLMVVLMAAGVAALLVFPKDMRVKDLVGWEPGQAETGAPAKDDSRLPTAEGETEAAATETSAGAPALNPILVDQLPFDTSCGLFLTKPDSRDVIFLMPQASAEQPSALGALNVEGNVVLVRRAEAEGDAIGQGAYQRQLFRNEDGTVTVVARVTPGAKEGGQRTMIESGELTVMMAGRSTLKIDVAGAAGC